MFKGRSVYPRLEVGHYKRSRLKNKANKTQLPSDKQNYKKLSHQIQSLNYKSNLKNKRR